MSRGGTTDALDVQPSDGCRESRRMSLSKTRGSSVINLDTSACQWHRLLSASNAATPQSVSVALRMQDE